ncbi:hypothetical protein TD95_003909 [Thielaviopsis punctulata]|uniref:COX assembly mitochondrial protein n=1 Tax=Thielaviopsis punctulata TaxID=72032 RepID=A0A0F4ZBC6_9PEZI|nr:hypothetical protein TD95_003909 [Thielaviopsis punctulata]
MHSHLHKPANIPCWEVIHALEECHARGFLWKSLGQCNTVKAAVNKCLGEQRALRATKNRETAMARRDRIKEKERELGL